MKKRPLARRASALMICLILACGLSVPAMAAELYPADVGAIAVDGSRQIIKTYVLSSEQDPADIPRGEFERDGWLYTLTDITERRASGVDARTHTETVELQTDTDDFGTILSQLSPTMEYTDDDGYCGILTLDLQSVKCDIEGYRKSNYTATTTREYPHLSSNDTSLIPKTITENGMTMTLDSVTWRSQRDTTVDYAEIPDSYTATATYAASASRSMITGYVTTATYTGEVARETTGDTTYIAYFSGTEIAPPEPEPTPEPEPVTKETSDVSPVIVALITAVAAALLAGSAVYLALRHNVKVYTVRDGSRVLSAKVRISAKKPVIDLTQLKGQSEDGCFSIELDRSAAKALNGKAIEVRFCEKAHSHTVAYEGNVYTIDVDFAAGRISATP